MDKSHMFWSEKRGGEYKDGIPVPRVTYRCKGAVTVEKGLRTRKHECKLVVDHPGACLCICDRKFNEKEEANA